MFLNDQQQPIIKATDYKSP